MGALPGGKPVPIAELARRRDIPLQFLEQLFATLRRAGLLQSQRGVKGGYTFVRDPCEVTVLEIVQLLDGEFDAEAAAAGRGLDEGGRRPARGTRRHDDRRRRAAGDQAAGAQMYHI